jgi:hypothetical protein
MGQIFSSTQTEGTESSYSSKANLQNSPSDALKSRIIVEKTKTDENGKCVRIQEIFENDVLVSVVEIFDENE